MTDNEIIKALELKPCPFCGNPYVDDSYCSCCGQALDWWMPKEKQEEIKE